MELIISLGNKVDLRFLKDKQPCDNDGPSQS